MPVKTGKNYLKRYDENVIQEALTAVKAGMSKLKASLTFGIPRSTIQFRLSDKFTKTQYGPQTVLTSQEEETLVRWIEKSMQKGFPRRMEDVQVSVKAFLDSNPRPNPFANNYPRKGCLLETA